MRKICLISFSTHIRSTFRNLLFRETFSDVTLVTDDLKQIPAHKIVLSTFSPVLGAILSSIPQPQPVLYLRGVREAEMKLLLHFLYEGEVSMHQEQVQEFMNILREMGVDGTSLSNNEEVKEEIGINTSDLIGDDEQVINEVDVEQIELETKVQKEGDIIKETDLIGDSDQVINEVDVEKSELETKDQKEGYKIKESNIGVHDYKRISKITQNHVCQHCSFTFTLKKHLFGHIDNEHEGLKYSCTECEYSSEKLDNLKYHEGMVHENISYSCNLCNYKHSRKYKLKKHQQSEHEGIRFPCTQCDYVGKQQVYLKRHIENEHENVTVVCKKCGFEANGPKGLKRHYRNEHWEKHSCDQCEYQTSDKGYLKEHTENKHKGIRYPCKFCTVEMVSLKSLKKHEKLKHT